MNKYMESTQQQIELPPRNELRLEIPNNTKDTTNTVTVTLLKGEAEMFGTEIVSGVPLEFRNASIAIFTWYGCTLQIVNAIKGSMYTSDKTCMVLYMNVNHNLNKLRRNAYKHQLKHGPRILIAGDYGVGKTTLSRILSSYAVRNGWKPIYVDLDPSSGGLMELIPGCIGATPIECPIGSIQSTSKQRALNILPLHTQLPLLYYFGHESPVNNTNLWKIVVQSLYDTIQERELNMNDDAKYAGTIIDCGKLIFILSITYIHA